MSKPARQDDPRTRENTGEGGRAPPPQPAPGAAPAPGPLKVPADKLRSMLGIREVAYVEGQEALAITDTRLSA